MRLRAVLLFVGSVLAGVCAGWWLASRPVTMPPIQGRAVDADQAWRDGVIRRLDELLRASQQESLAAAELPVRRDEVSREGDGDLRGRLERIEASLQQLRQELETRTAGGPGPLAKEKDQKLVSEAAERGVRTPRTNARDFWGWTPREVHARFGKPDSTHWNDGAAQLDWFYFGPEANGALRYKAEGGALQFRFEGGMVIDVWP